MISFLFNRLKSPVSLTILLIGMILLFSDYHFRWKEEQWKYAVHTDAADYYRYLPMVFIDHEFDSQEENPQVVKYFVGTAICYLPFFTLAYYSSSVAGIPADGYTVLFPVLISIGTLFYLLLGLSYLSKFLRFYGLKDWIICVVLVAMAFGTMAFHYTVMAPGWSHIVAFGLVCYLLYHCKKLLVSFHSKSIAAVIAVGSLLFFVRPTDVLIVLIVPFLAADSEEFLKTLKRVFTCKKAIAAGVLLAMIPAVCQLIVYRWRTGEFLIWSYTKEGFNFARPEIANVLFSYAKGLFVYTPVCLLALAGLIVLYRRNRYQFWGALLYMSVNIYVISSWWCWNYGASYGTRAFIEHLPGIFSPACAAADRETKMGSFFHVRPACAFHSVEPVPDVPGECRNPGPRFQNYEAGLLARFPADRQRGKIHCFSRTSRAQECPYSCFGVVLPSEKRDGIFLCHVLCERGQKRELYTVCTGRFYTGLWKLGIPCLRAADAQFPGESETVTNEQGGVLLL